MARFPPPRHSGERRNPASSRVSETKSPAVYIMANRYRGTIYIGVTSNLVARVSQHRQDVVDGFTRKYGLHLLVFYEPHATMENAILREKQIKDWKRAWKIALIETSNPEWRDMFDSLL
jgi:putative endonuclease